MKKACSLFIVFFLSACVSSNDFDRMRRDISEVQRSNEEARKDIDSLKEKTSGVAKEDSFSAIKESQADLFAKVNTTSSGLQELRGRFDENRYFTEKALKEFTSEKDLLMAQIAGLETQVRALKDKLAALEQLMAQIAGLEMQVRALKDKLATPEQQRAIEPGRETTGPTSSNEDPGGAASVSPEAKSEPVSESKTKAYDAAYQLFKDRKFREAREGFEAFLREYPKTDLSDNAQFWIAETYYNEKDFESAILSYETLIKKYPDSSKASSGMLKQGLAFVEIGDAKTGKIILIKLMEKYPESKEVDAAKRKIAELDKKPPKKR